MVSFLRTSTRFAVRYKIFLLLASFCYGIAYFLYHFSSAQDQTEKYIEDVRENIRTAVSDSDNDFAKIKDILRKNFKPSSLDSTKAKYPFFIFHHGKMAYWSDATFVPSYDLLKSPTPYISKVIVVGEYTFLVRRISYQSERNRLNYEIYSLIELSHPTDWNVTEHLNYHIFPSNLNIFANNPSISLTPSTNDQFNIPDKAHFLFSIAPQSDTQTLTQLPTNVLICACIGLFFMSLFMVGLVHQFNKKRFYGRSFLILLAYFGFIRGVMLYFNTYSYFQESSKVFNPSYMGSSFFTPTIGDLLLNLVVSIILLLFLVTHYYRFRIYFQVLHWSNLYKILIANLLIFVSFGVFCLCHSLLSNLFIYSYLTLDLSLKIDLWTDTLDFSCILIFLLVSFCYFLSIHLLSNIFIKLTRQHPVAQGIQWLLLSSVISIVFYWKFYAFSSSENPQSIYFDIDVWLLCLHALLLVLIYTFKLPKYLYTFRYQTIVYLFSVAIVCAIVSTKVNYNRWIAKDTKFKKLFGEKYFSQGDKFSEVLLLKIYDQTISKNFTKVKTVLTSTSVSVKDIKAILEEDVYTKSIIKSYFKSYQSKILVFDSQGRSLNSGDAEGRNLNTYLKKYQKPVQQTDNTTLYLVNEPSKGFFKEYFQLIRLQDAQGLYGYLVLLFSEYGETSGSGKVTLGESGILVPEIASYGYAIYEGKKLISIESKGYPFNAKLSSFLQKKALYTTGILYENVRYVGGKSGNKTIIFASTPPSNADIYANFSYLFLYLVITIIIGMLIYATNYGVSIVNINFATKIQIYLNLAFVLPLILIMGITLSIIGSKLSENQQKSYFEQAEGISISIRDVIQQYTKTSLQSDSLSYALTQINNIQKHYLNIFDPAGYLITSTRGVDDEMNKTNQYLPRSVYRAIVEEHKNQYHTIDQVGNIDYSNVFVAIKSNEDKLLGVLNVPFYDAKVVNEKEVLPLVSTLLNTFTTLFMLLLILSYFASNLLTVPLRFIINKLRKVDFSKTNEPILWRSNDEIGMLIKAYNQMLIKLEESKIALADSNKQSAWQQMAKQVAHEIKNPLTPMKLSLQLLQHKLSRGTTINTALIKDQIESLTGQIDNLSYIANSFSDFARMPIPKREVFDIVSEANKIITLFQEDSKLKLLKDLPPSPTFVIGDRHLTGNIIKNLVVNAIQSVPPERNPVISIRISKGVETITFSISDNGSGINEDDRSKIFLLDFSTKQGGSGVGLALAKWVVDNANGSIWFNTTASKGSTFYFTLHLA